MVLNMLRVEDANPEHVLRSSFHQYQQETLAPGLELQADELLREADSIIIENESEVSDYFALQSRCEKLLADTLAFMHIPRYYMPFLQPGRVLFIRFNKVCWGWGVLVQLKKMNPAGSVNNGVEAAIGLESGKMTDYLMDVLLCVELLGEGEDEVVQDIPYKPTDASTGEMQVIRVVVHAVEKFSAIRLTLPRDMNKETVRRSVHKSIIDIQHKFALEGGLPLLSPIADMGITEPEFRRDHEEWTALQNTLDKQSLSSSVDGVSRLRAYEARLELLEKARLIRLHARETQAVVMKDELRRLKRVLKRLGYITDKGVLELKGRFCCEITTADEVVLTDMIFDGVFNDLTAEQAVGLLSCFVHKEPSKDTNPKIRPDLDAAFQCLKEAARVVAKCSIDAKMAIDEEEYVSSFNPAMIDVAYSWAKGSKFVDICRLTDIFEGSIIRTLKRLEELLRQLANAALAIGNVELKNKFEEGADKIRRGVVFAASLYL
jgi:ATP-dependent RNA helicase DOB1